MNPMHPEFVPSSRNREQTCPSLSGHRPCELARGPTAMPRYPQIVLFSCLLRSQLTNQRFRPARRMAGGFSVNPEPLNLEPVNGYEERYREIILYSMFIFLRQVLRLLLPNQVLTESRG